MFVMLLWPERECNTNDYGKLNKFSKELNDEFMKNNVIH